MKHNRVRKVDVKNLPIEQIEDISKQLSDKIDSRLISVKAELDQILKIYGLKIEVGFEVKPLV